MSRAQRFYYVFGFLALVLLILIITCAEISIVLCYFQLCNEDYNWWWRAFLTSGSSGLYLFGYSIMYFHSQLEIDGFVPTLMYFTYMAVFSTLFFLVTGAFGACSRQEWFIRTYESRMARHDRLLLVPKVCLGDLRRHQGGLSCRDRGRRQ